MHRKNFLLLLGLLSFNGIAQDLFLSLAKAEDALYQTPQKTLEIATQINQEKNLDSLQRLHTLDLIVRAYESMGQTQKSKQVLSNLKLLAEQTDNQGFLARTHRHDGNLLYAESNYAMAENEYRKALILFEQLSSQVEVAHTLHKLSSAVRTQGKYHSAKKIAQQALELNQQLSQTRGITSSLIALALAHKFLGNYAKSLDSLQSSLALSLSIDDANTVADTFYNIASIYEITEDYQKAKDYYSQALTLDTEAGFKNDIAYDHIRLAEMESMLGNSNGAQTHVSTAYHLFKAVGSTRNQGWALIVKGKIEGKAGHFQEARRLLGQGIKLAKQAQDPLLVTRGHMVLSELAFNTEQYTEALDLIAMVIDDAFTRDNAKQIEFLLALKGKVLTAQNNYKSALNTINRLRDYRDKRNEEIRGQTIAQLQNDIESQDKLYKIALLEKDRVLAQTNIQKVRLERNAGIAVFLMVVLAALFWALKEREKRKVSTIRQTMLSETADRKNALLADVSHELRTPLTILRLHVESLQHDIADDPASTYSMLNTKVDELNTLIEDLYQLSLADTNGLNVNIAPISAQRFLQGIFNQHLSLFDKAGLTLSTDIDIDPEQIVWVDEQRIKQTITNLLSNSIRYTSSPGIVEVVSTLNESNWHICISDSAPGVDESELQLLFDRLYRCEVSRSRATGGAGLGLAICKTLVEAHNGLISIASSQQGGLRISLDIPRKRK